MGYVPLRPPPPLPLIPDGIQPAITLDAAFDAWIMTPVEDTRTLHEYANNPVPLVRRLPMLPPPPPSRARTGEMRRSEHRTVIDIGGVPYAYYIEDRQKTRAELPPDLPDLECNECHVITTENKAMAILAGCLCVDCTHGIYVYRRAGNDTYGSLRMHSRHGLEP